MISPYCQYGGGCLMLLLFLYSCCDVVDGGSNECGRADEVFSTKDMMAPTPKLKTPMEICGWFVGLSDFWIFGLLGCWFIGLLDCWIVVGCLCVSLVCFVGP